MAPTKVKVSDNLRTNRRVSAKTKDIHAAMVASKIRAVKAVKDSGKTGLMLQEEVVVNLPRPHSLRKFLLQ
jgi:hypothetical protein